MRNCQENNRVLEEEEQRVEGKTMSSRGHTSGIKGE